MGGQSCPPAGAQIAIRNSIATPRPLPPSNGGLCSIVACALSCLTTTFRLHGRPIVPTCWRSDRNPQFYSYAKATTTLEWRSLLDSGMRLELPHHDLQTSWEANRAHLLALRSQSAIL